MTLTADELIFYKICTTYYIETKSAKCDKWKWLETYYTSIISIS